MSKARNAGKVVIFVCFESWLRTLLMFIVFLARRARFGGKASWKTFVLKGFTLSFCESLVVENTRFGRLHYQFLRKSRGKRLFWKASFPSKSKGPTK